ncbi:MAG: VWA domain-containing protein [Terriglobales bacterium]
MRILTPAIVIAFLLHAGAAAQDNKPPEPAPILTARTELVIVPTLVREKSGAAIAGLAKTDFTLLENGAERTIAFFEEIKTTPSRQQRRAVPAGEFSNYLVNEAVPRRLTVIVMDSINTQFSDRSYAREQILKFLGEMAGSQEPIALLQLQRGGVRIIHDFTTDPAVLAQVLGRFRGGAEAPMADTQESLPDPTVLAESQAFAGMLDSMEQNYLAAQRMLAATVTLDGLQQIARAYAAIPGRKSLIWASGGFPFSIDDMSNLLAGNAPLRPSYLTDILPLYEKTWQALNDANIALYPVDVRGLVVGGLSAATHVTASGLQTANRRAAWAHQDTLTTFEQFADMTGGKAYFNTNDLVHAFHDSVEDSASYYMLGFYLPSEDRKPGWRKLQVRVKAAHAQVRARSGFYVMPQDKDKTKSKENDIALALSSPLDFTAVPVVARWTETTPSGDKKRTAFELILPANAALVVESDQNHMSIDFDAAARAPNGKVVASNGRTLDAHLKPESLQQIRSSGITYKGALDLPSGQYTVRFVVRDNLSGRMGSLAAPLTVP